ncbi:MAG: acetate--CoA ligase family protein [Pseudomonadota bacterium]
MTRDLSRLLRPRSLALIGGGWAANAVRATAAMRFDGDVWPVHPTRQEVAGRPAYPSLDALPHAPDAAFVAINRDASPAMMAKLAAMGAGGAVAFASGFTEAGDSARQAALTAAAGDMPMLGPNCYGLINYLDGALLWPDQHGGKRVARGVAIVSQSSNIAINMTMAARALPIAYLVCVGNQAQTGLAELGAALAADPRVTAIGFYIEGVGDPAAFFEMVQAAGKPVVAIKSGRSAAAQTGAVSHTASLAGSNAASRTFFQRCGVPLLGSIPEFLEALKLLHIHGPLPGRSLCSVSCSGGEASITADAAVGRDVTFTPFTDADKARISDTLSDLVTVANPLDYHTFIWGDLARMTDCFSAVMETGFDLTLFIIDFPRTDRCTAIDWDPAIAAIKAAAHATGQRAAVVTSLPENLPEAVAEDFAAAGIAPLFGIDDAVAAIEAAATCAEASSPARAPLWQPAPTGDAPPARVLSEASAKSALAEAGLAVPEGAQAASPEDAATIAARLARPVALKRLGIAHKTEAGAVALGLTADEVAAAAHQMGPGPYLVEAMIEGAIAELIVGAHRDPAYGLVMTIGAGGVVAELLDDSTTCFLPVSADDARAAILSLRLAPLLTGYRGRPVADLDAAADAIAALSTYLVENHALVEELDINPLIVTATGAFVADALIRQRT